MFTLVAILMFAGALAAAATAIYATIVPALPKIQAALAGRQTPSSLPPLPSRRATAMRVTVQPVSSMQPAHWRAAA